MTTEELKLKPDDLLELVLRGEEVIIASGGRKVARMVPYIEPKKRVLGRLRGQIQVAADFDDPLPPELLAEFEK